MVETETCLAGVPEVVDKALVLIAAEQGIQKPRFRVTSGSGKGDGMMSTLYRCVIQDEDSADRSELSIMVKLPREGLADDVVQRMFGVEGLVYKTLTPALRDVAGLREPLPWLKHYFSAVEGDEHLLCIAIEDFVPAGFVKADKAKGLDADHCRLALEQVARFHGASMALERLRPDVFEAVKNSIPDISRIPKMYNGMKGITVGLSILPDLVKHRFPEGSAVHTMLQELWPIFTTFFYKFLWPMPPADGRGCTLIHGDCHVNNLAFQYDKDGAVKACKLYDFQATSYKMAAQDFMLLLFCCTEKPMRDEHWDSLLRGYIAEVHATLRAAGCRDPEDIFSWDTLQEQLRRFVAPALCFQPAFISYVTADDEALDKLRDTNLARGEKSLIRPSPEVIERFVGLLESVEAWGWIPSTEDMNRWAAED